jgi:hypothetical protein
MTNGVNPDPQSQLNADQLGLALSHTRDELVDFDTDDQRSRHEQAIEQMENYVAMLRDTSLAGGYGPSGRARRAFSFKLEFADGRWNVDEKELEATPRVGDIVSFDDGKSWCVLASEFVRALPAHKPMREFYVCAPVA